MRSVSEMMNRTIDRRFYVLLIYNDPIESNVLPYLISLSGRRNEIKLDKEIFYFHVELKSIVLGSLKQRVILMTPKRSLYP